MACLVRANIWNCIQIKTHFETALVIKINDHAIYSKTLIKEFCSDSKNKFSEKGKILFTKGDTAFVLKHSEKS